MPKFITFVKVHSTDYLARFQVLTVICGTHLLTARSVNDQVSLQCAKAIQERLVHFQKNDGGSPSTQKSFSRYVFRLLLYPAATPIYVTELLAHNSGHIGVQSR